MDKKKQAEFRTLILENEEFRRNFCHNPVAALREIGMDVPEGVDIPPIDDNEMEERVKKVKAELGDDVKLLYSEEDFEKLRGERPAATKRFDKVGDLINISRKIGDIGGVYRISAFGTADW